MNTNSSHRPYLLWRWLLPGLAMLMAFSCPAAQTTLKKLIEFGWDEPDTPFLRQHIAEMEKTPFDGCVFHGPGDFLWQCSGKRTFTQTALRPAITGLKNTPLKKLTHNFLRLNGALGDVDRF